MSLAWLGCVHKRLGVARSAAWSRGLKRLMSEVNTTHNQVFGAITMASWVPGRMLISLGSYCKSVVLIELQNLELIRNQINGARQ